MSVTLTERAAQHAQRFLSGPQGGNGLRVGIKSTGCSGYTYIVQPARDITAHDSVFESHGVQVIVDDESLKYLDGTVVDFTRDGLNENFRFQNPNVTATCGCGESFNV
ncbi:MAG: iron-sulfur cluster assembly accessory protein [Gammaproteobacteria bacterium]|nr:iron-sulfur cluster assembly accessory protein [Gammaproteobacteria bacterium]